MKRKLATSPGYPGTVAMANAMIGTGAGWSAIKNCKASAKLKMNGNCV